MRSDAVRPEVFVDLGKELLDVGGAARAGGARLRVDYDRPRIDQIAPNQRDQSEQRPGRIASGIRHDSRLAQLAHMELAEAVNRFLEQRGRGMLGAVNRAIDGRVLEAKIRRQVHHFDPAGDQLGDHRGAGPLRQARDGDLGTADEQVRPQLLERGQIDPGQMAVYLGNLAPGVVLGGERGQLDERMRGQDAHGFNSGIAGSTQHCRFDPAVRRHRGSFAPRAEFKLRSSSSNMNSPATPVAPGPGLGTGRIRPRCPVKLGQSWADWHRTNPLEPTPKQAVAATKPRTVTCSPLLLETSPPLRPIAPPRGLFPAPRREHGEERRSGCLT